MENKTPGSSAEAYLDSVVRAITEARDEIRKHNQGLFDKGGPLDRLYVMVADLKASVDASNANWKMLRGQLSSQGTRIASLETTIGNLRQLLTEALLRLGELENKRREGLSVQEEGPIKILVVDAVGDLRRTLEEILGRYGMEVTSAGSLEEARQALVDHEIEVALVDVGLPDGSGLEILGEWQEAATGPEFIIMSAMTDSGTTEEALRLGAYSFIEKPFASNESLVLIIQKAAEHRRLLVFKRKFQHAQASAPAPNKDHQ